ncbi:MAG: Gfo/Idh/MocA family oxidoreductase [Acidobacteriota bacterium]|nr:Gfo/Idh/MocA family oxidoreductase [Acidobacteriota bacterium]
MAGSPWAQSARVGFGIVGAGMIGRFHCQAVQAIEDAQLIGVCDVVQERAAGLAREFDAPHHFTDVRDLCAAEGVDIIVIGVPSGLHCQAALAAIEAGKHVIVEKPIDISLERADAMIAAAREAGVLLSVVSQKRFEPATQHLKAAVDAGKFGRIAFADVYVKWWRTPEYYSQGGWKGTKAMDGGGALINQSVHQIDLLRWIMGPVRRVYGKVDARVHPIEAEDTAAAVVEFECGAMGVIQGSTASYPGHPAILAITGELGSARLEDGTLTEWKIAGEEACEAEVLERFAGLSGSGGGDPASINARGHELQFRDVIEALRTGRPALTDGEEGRKALELILAIYESSDKGMPVTLGSR